MSRRELTFQSHIIDTYKLEGGTGRKWASEWQKGPPDLVLSCPVVGTHLAEVKHHPTFSVHRAIQNPMTPKQISVAEEYIKAGSHVFLFLVSGNHARDAALHVYKPLITKTNEGHLFSLPFVMGAKFQGLTNKIREYCCEQ